MREQIGVLLDAWCENFPGEAATVAEAIKLATHDPIRNEPEADTECRRRLLEAMLEVAGRHGAIDGRDLGKFISRHERRFEGGLRFENDDMSRRAVRWLVKKDGELKRVGFARRAKNGECLQDRLTNNSPNSPNGGLSLDPPDDVDRWLRGEPA